MMRGYLWEALGEEIAEEFDSLSGSMLDITQHGYAGRGKLQEYLWDAKYWLREDTREVAKQYRNMKRDTKLGSRSKSWEQVILSQLSILTPTTDDLKCKRGHNLSMEENVLRKRPNGSSECRVCHNERAKERARFRAAQKKELSMREKMPSERSGITQRFTMTTRNFNADGSLGDGTREIKGYITASVYPELRDDGTPHPLAGCLGEVFVKIGRPGSTEALLDQWAVSFSRELQRGEDLEALCKKHRHTQFEPSGAVSGVKGITRCTSPVDLVVNYLLIRFGKTEELK